jgi:hypothetical protein
MARLTPGTFAMGSLDPKGGAGSYMDLEQISFYQRAVRRTFKRSNIVAVLL